MTDEYAKPSLRGVSNGIVPHRQRRRGRPLGARGAHPLKKLPQLLTVTKRKVLHLMPKGSKSAHLSSNPGSVHFWFLKILHFF